MPKLLTTLIVSLTLITSPAYAEHGYNRDRGHRDHGHHERYKHHSHDKHDNDNSSVWAGVALIGAIAGLALLADRNEPTYNQPSYVEPAYPSYTPPQAASNVWYYCQSSRAYYPYTRACPEGWQAVPAGGY